MLNLINQIVARAKANRQRIVLPEGTEERTLKAANMILTDEVADLILLGKPAEINELATKWGLGNIGKATIIDPETSPKHEEYAQLLCELRKKKGMTIEEARKLTSDPLFYGCLMIKSGDADGQLAGARNTTGNVLRPALQIIKTAPGITCVSGAMLLLTHAPEYGKNGILVMGDVAVTPVPDANQFAVVDNFLVFKFWAGEQLAYMMPVGTGDLKAVLWELIEDARKENQHFCMLGVCSNMRADLEAILPGQFTFTEDRDYADYIYLRSDLSTLKGKKFQAKRNHINRFRNTYPDYEYTPITPDRIQECLDLEAEWCKVNHCDQQEGTGNERRALIYALHNFEALGLTGGILHVNGKIVAFTFGMPINHETFGVHVEKADTSIEGAYAMINYEFANRIPEQYIYINREEDLGLEGLRKAKLSYQPVTILEKYMACLKEHPMNMVKW